MKCQNCGEEISANAKFCKKCGTPTSQPVKQKSRISPLIIVLIIGAVLIAAAGAGYAYVVYMDVSPVEITELDSSNHADVLKNSEIASNIPDSNVSDAIVDAAKSGVPIYKIGDGSGPVTVISAGVMGDQLVPSVAAMKIIDYLDGRKIKGTVYVIPFASPKAISQNTELTDGVNLNTVADEDGTVSKKIVDFAVDHDASAVGDFHETQAGRDPGITTIMCSKSPTYESYELARNMAGLSLETTFTYTVAGVAYDGAIEDECNLLGTPAVTPLVVVSSHGEVTDSAVSESYDQMLSILITNGNLGWDDGYLKLANSDIDGL